MTEYKVKYRIGDATLTVTRHSRDDMEAFDNANKERLEIAKKQEPLKVSVLSVTQV
jgi:hypothetical protein